jgi:signal transduction histidine kinase
MHLNNLIHSTGLKLAAACTALFCFATLATAVVAYFLIADDLDSWLDRSLSETATYLVDEFQEGGAKALAASVEQHANASQSSHDIFLLLDNNGQKSAGNTGKYTTALGWYNADAKQFGLTGNRGFRVFSQKVGVNTLIVARSETAIEEIGGIIEKAFVVGAVIMAVSALLAGTLIGIRAQKRVEAFQLTLDAVSRGDMNSRIDVTPDGRDDIDRIALQLNKTLDHLKSAMQSMQHVTVDIAHDLKSPIARLRNRLSDIDSGLAASDAARIEVQGAIEETDNIAQTFDSILRIAQIESGEQRRHFTTLDLGQVVTRAAEIYGAVVEDAGGYLSVNLHLGSQQIVGDERLLLQLLANLIENSVRHCREAPSIAVGVKPVSTGVCLTVTDNGPGIPEQERENVKVRFYRLDKSRTTKGSGLGLALVTAISGLHSASMLLTDNKPGLSVQIIFPSYDSAY